MAAEAVLDARTARSLGTGGIRSLTILFAEMLKSHPAYKIAAKVSDAATRNRLGRRLLSTGSNAGNGVSEGLSPYSSRKRPTKLSASRQRCSAYERTKPSV